MKSPDNKMPVEGEAPRESGDGVVEIPSSELREIPEEAVAEFFPGEILHDYEFGRDLTVTKVHHYYRLRDEKTGQETIFSQSELRSRTSPLEVIDDDEKTEEHILPEEKGQETIWKKGFRPGQLVKLNIGILAQYKLSMEMKFHLSGFNNEMQSVHVEVFDTSDKLYVTSIEVDLEVFLKDNETTVLANRLTDVIE